MAFLNAITGEATILVRQRPGVSLEGGNLVNDAEATEMTHTGHRVKTTLCEDMCALITSGREW